MQPYPSPERIKTIKRCKFSLPGKRYNCRSLGCYVLNGKGYCAPHYDATWKALNPEYGQQCDWHRWVNKFNGEPYPYDTCRKCGAIRRREGLAFHPCRGVMPEIRLWATSL